MKHLLTIALLLSLLFVVACGEEPVKEVDDAAIEAIEETALPVEAEVTDEAMAIETADKLFTAVGEMDRETVMELCFQDISVVAGELGLTNEEQVAAREQQAAELELFELGWAELSKDGTALLEWNNLTVTDAAPAEGNPDLIVYMVGVELVAVDDGGEPEMVDHSVVIFNLNEMWFAQWPF
ncbi:hypothetical protein K8R78_00370 [bacterium]|nr:hypothetical protein [bacterium]